MMAVGQEPGASSPLLLLKLPADRAFQRSNGESAVGTSGRFYTWAFTSLVCHTWQGLMYTFQGIFSPSWWHHPGPQLPTPPPPPAGNTSCRGL